MRSPVATTSKYSSGVTGINAIQSSLTNEALKLGGFTQPQFLVTDNVKQIGWWMAVAAMRFSTHNTPLSDLIAGGPFLNVLAAPDHSCSILHRNHDTL